MSCSSRSKAIILGKLYWCFCLHILIIDGAAVVVKFRQSNTQCLPSEILFLLNWKIIKWYWLINYLGHSMCILPKLMRVGLYQRWQGHELFQPQQGHNFGQRPENYQKLEKLNCFNNFRKKNTKELMLAGGVIWTKALGWKPTGILKGPGLANKAWWPFHVKPSFSVTRSDFMTGTSASSPASEAKSQIMTWPAVPPITNFPVVKEFYRSDD